MGMERIELNQNWKMKRSGDAAYVDAVVPGSVYQDLLDNGRMEDPYFKDNEDAACALMDADYEYVCPITLDAGQLAGDEVLLHFDGLDTLADIQVNGIKVGEACNQHRVWEFPVKALLHEGENELRVVFHSSLQYIADAHKMYGNLGNDDTFEGFMHLRKAHYMFGWDWGAHLPDAGIFRPAYLLCIDRARVENLHIFQEHADGRVTLQVEPEMEVWGSREGLSGRLQVYDPDGVCVGEGEGLDELTITLENPRLWWPNGLGSQPLYRVCFTAADENGNPVDRCEKRIGLRTLTMLRQKDEWGETFAQTANGKAYFAMGADYIPEEHILGRRNPERTRQLLLDCKAANYNSIRVWGGGLYPDDWFYDICDELGLVVWQDFMFACSVYELTERFEANMRLEARDNIKRLRHHASLGLWCGNNEMEMFVDERNWVTKPTEVRDYLMMYERILPEELKKYDPVTFYWPASPSSGGSFDNPNDPNRGDVHYWKVWHGNRPFTEYRKFYFRYASEFGFQAFPAVKTLETVTDDPSDLNPFSYVMEKHQRNYGANGKIMGYMQQMYRYPNDFSTFVYASQLLQADAIRYGVEHFRRNRNQNRCMGAIYWQLNDCWPVISWSSIDYYGRWKALHYYAKRFFAPVLLSCAEEGWMSKEANMNRQHFAFEKSIWLNVANETLEEQTVTVKWSARNAKGEVISTEGLPCEQTASVCVPPLSTVWLDKVLLPEIDVFSEYVSYEAFRDGVRISGGTVIFSYPKYFRYADPRLTVRREERENGTWIGVSACAYARSVEIQNTEEDLVLSDNYFDLNGGEKWVKVLRGEAENLRVRSVYDIR